MTGRVQVLLGTTKGAFVLDGNGDRANWRIRGPFCDGCPINHVIGDPGTGRLWAAGGSEWHGVGVWRSDDGGHVWTQSSDGIEAGDGAQPLSSLWSLGRADDVLYAGSKPADLFASRDGGRRWAKVTGLTDHPSSADWQPGAAGLVLHSIVSDPADPAKLWVGLSAAGVFATEDGGATWDRRNRMSNAAHAAHDHDHDHDDTEVGQCVHNIVRAGGARDRMYQQNHHGVFRSVDGGRTWDAAGAGLPSTFGFPVVVHPHDPDTVWVFPLNGDSIGRFPLGASAAVWRSRDAGETWVPLQNGLPTQDCFFTVLRQGMAVDQGTPAGLYFGTNSGSVFASPDEGDTWTEIARHLPTILSVETVTTG